VEEEELKELRARIAELEAERDRARLEKAHMDNANRKSCMHLTKQELLDLDLMEVIKAAVRHDII